MNSLLVEARTKVRECFEKAERVYGTDIGIIAVNFRIKGMTAGVYHHSPPEIRLNEVLFQQNHDHFLSQTVPHEAAHHINAVVFQGRGHDWNWKCIMHMLGCDPKRCHDYDTSTARAKAEYQRKSYPYHCACRSVVMLSSVRHNRVRRKVQTYHCRKCGQTLIANSPY